MPTTNGSVKVDADLSDWSKVNGFVTDLLNITGATYTDGQASYKCVYDGTRVYLALEIPGEYRFDETDANKCAAIATMMKVSTTTSCLSIFVKKKLIHIGYTFSSDWYLGNIH